MRVHLVTTGTPPRPIFLDRIGRHVVGLAIRVGRRRLLSIQWAGYRRRPNSG